MHKYSFCVHCWIIDRSREQYRLFATARVIGSNLLLTITVAVANYRLLLDYWSGGQYPHEPQLACKLRVNVDYWPIIDSYQSQDVQIDASMWRSCEWERRMSSQSMGYTWCTSIWISIHGYQPLTPTCLQVGGERGWCPCMARPHAHLAIARCAWGFAMCKGSIIDLHVNQTPACRWIIDMWGQLLTPIGFFHFCSML